MCREPTRYALVSQRRLSLPPGWSQTWDVARSCDVPKPSHVLQDGIESRLMGPSHVERFEDVNHVSFLEAVQDCNCSVELSDQFFASIRGFDSPDRNAHPSRPA